MFETIALCSVFPQRTEILASTAVYLNFPLSFSLSLAICVIYGDKREFQMSCFVDPPQTSYFRCFSEKNWSCDPLYAWIILSCKLFVTVSQQLPSGYLIVQIGKGILIHKYIQHSIRYVCEYMDATLKPKIACLVSHSILGVRIEQFSELFSSSSQRPQVDVKNIEKLLTSW